MTAHPKIDPETGEMLFFGYSTSGPMSKGMSFHVVSAEGELTESQVFDAPYSSMVHDFMVTQNYVLFPIMPLSGSLDRAMQGRPAFAWEPELGTYLGVLKRGESVDKIRWFEGSPSYVFHPMNAFEQDGKLICDVCEYQKRRSFLDLMDRWATPVKPMRNCTGGRLMLMATRIPTRASRSMTGSQNFPDWTSVEQV